ncbi:MAG TPA: hypothetical protein VN611_07385 [Patescibacteria group bacterium]|nr:hypothetical protein [Patescibacteria group bacterium]
MDGFVKVAVLDNAFEAQVLTAALAEEAIEHYLKCYQDAAYNGLFQSTGGWGAVYASAASSETIQIILTQIRQPAAEDDNEGGV